MKLLMMIIGTIILFNIVIRFSSAGQIRNYCKSVVGESYALMLVCVEQEEEAKRWLEYRSIDSKIISYCKSVVGESYALMQVCVEQEEEAKRRLGY